MSLKEFEEECPGTVRLTSIYYRVPGNQELLIAHSETFKGLVEEMRTLTWGIV